MSLPKFTLLPWEFPGAPGSRRADAVTTTLWRGKEVMMRLKIRENRLFFAPMGEKGGRLWSVLGPQEKTAEAADELKSQPEEIVRRFQLALQKGAWGRVVFFQLHSENLEPRRFLPHQGMPLNKVMAIVQRDGKAELRLIYDDERIPCWVEWDELARFGLCLDQFETWPHHRLERFLRAQLKPIFRFVLEHPLSTAATQRASIGYYFARGSQEELEQLIRATSWLYEIFELARTINHDGKLYYYILARRLNGEARIYRHEYHKVFMPEAVKELFALLLHLHCPVGQKFQKVQERTRQYPIEKGFTVEPPTSEQRLEALETLRELTRGTKIEAAVMAVLTEYPPQI